MKQTTILVKFDAERLKAILYNLPDRDSGIEAELRRHLEEMYESRVADEVKKFIAYQEPVNTSERAKPKKVIKEEGAGREQQ